MSSFEQRLRIRRWSYDEKRQRAADLEAMIASFSADAAALGETADVQSASPEAARLACLHLTLANLSESLTELKEEIAALAKELAQAEQVLQLRKRRPARVLRVRSVQSTRDAFQHAGLPRETMPDTNTTE